jgi:hypothetical protein
MFSKWFMAGNFFSNLSKAGYKNRINCSKRCAFMFCSFLLAQKRTKKGHPRMIFSIPLGRDGRSLDLAIVLMIFQLLGPDP